MKPKSKFHPRGSAAAQFILIFPFFLLFLFLYFDFFYLAFRQLSLENACEKKVQALAASPEKTMADLKSDTEDWATKRFHGHVHAFLSMESVPYVSSGLSDRRKKTLWLLHLQLIEIHFWVNPIHRLLLGNAPLQLKASRQALWEAWNVSS